MSRLFKAFGFGLLFPAALVFSLSGCSKGPAEKAGENLDNALGTSDSKADGPFENTGESIDKATDGKNDQ